MRAGSSGWTFIGLNFNEVQQLGHIESVQNFFCNFYTKAVCRNMNDRINVSTLKELMRMKYSTKLSAKVIGRKGQTEWVSE